MVANLPARRVTVTPDRNKNKLPKHVTLEKEKSRMKSEWRMDIHVIIMGEWLSFFVKNKKVKNSVKLLDLSFDVTVMQWHNAMS